ncbi:MAG: bifunctional demethylmenaquinone methyltransferase/2-methoxy-6-polyprenyl-1,4-benzoquinol methylase UbiE [Bdellovibrionales bacterium]|nr:bifunctional demethylmenaquinone methyltransferase/2-methoxy-6-polyprenyl-1,4-benzoquinol methylase UbiE [Bdellovibrionales bacterium]
MKPSETLSGPPAEDIQSLFQSISSGYDTANDVMTGGMARLWRKKLVQRSQAQPGDAILDCATGTGDLAIEFAKVVGSQGEVIGSDFCQGMLDKAPAKAEKNGLKIQFEIADATNLPYEDHRFDVVSIAYGIRNVSDPVKALSEMARVTKPGGRVMILETGDQQNPLLRKGFQFYFKYIVPRIGGLITGQKSAYEYLQKSSSKFPSQQNFIDLMNQTQSFSKCDFISLMGGASFIYRGVVNSPH